VDFLPKANPNTRTVRERVDCPPFLLLAARDPSLPRNSFLSPQTRNTSSIVAVLILLFLRPRQQSHLVIQYGQVSRISFGTTVSGAIGYPEQKLREYYLKRESLNFVVRIEWTKGSFWQTRIIYSILPHIRSDFLLSL